MRGNHCHTHLIVVCTHSYLQFTSLQAEQYAVTATPTPQRKGPGGEVTTDEDIIGREEKGLLDEHLQVATAQTKFT